MAIDTASPAKNPTVDEVLGQVTTQIQAACEPITIDEDAIADFVYTYRVPFSRRLGVALWEDEKANVLNAATQHGTIAKALASLRGVDSVSKEMLKTASALVVENCRFRFGPQGIWCS